MSSLERKFEKITLLLENLRNEASGDSLLIVEGRRDAKTLRKIGVKGEIFTIKSCGENIVSFIDKIGENRKKEVILLMDFDRRGKEMTERLVKNLEKMKIKVNLTFWKELLSLVGNDLKDIEGLGSYIETLEKKVRGKIIFPYWML